MNGREQVGLLTPLVEQIGRHQRIAPAGSWVQSLDLDSLDTLQFAMDIETALEMDIEIVNFPDTLTIAQLAERLTVMKAHQRLVGSKILQARAILA